MTCIKHQELERLLAEATEEIERLKEEEEEEETTEEVTEEEAKSEEKEEYAEETKAPKKVIESITKESFFSEMEKLKEENESLWFMLDELRESDKLMMEKVTETLLLDATPEAEA